MIKLDRRLVAEVEQGKPLPGELEAVSALLKTGKTTVVAEGIESAERALAIRSTGVRLAQGFHFSPPLSADAFKAGFAERSPLDSRTVSVASAAVHSKNARSLHATY
jgi:EAL domain-containing protein (putative c-di-GMP-specific phosphodiesterase class I)